VNEPVTTKLAILAHSARHLLHRVGPGRIVAVVGLTAGCIVAAFGFAPDSMPVDPPQLVVRSLSQPALVPLATEGGYWRQERIERGDTLGSVLARLGVDDAVAQNFLRTDTSARSLYQLRPGKTVRVKTSDDGRMLALRYLAQGGELLAIDRGVDPVFTARSTIPQPVARLELRSNDIRSSLYAAADDVGLPDTVTTQLTDLFSGDVDFYHDLRRGDHFTVVYEMRDIDGQSAGAGRIVAAEFINKGVVYRAFLWHGGDDADAYYAQDGRSLKKAFLRSPVEFTRISSGFSLERFHPFLQTWRAHKGVDFAAPMGTPVHAAGDGRITIAGRQNGYGNIIVLQHNGAFSTAYAHLSGFAPGVTAGAHVTQGDVIGYVGQTGWATGPHLHYEFRVNDEPRDPLSVALPNAQPIAPGERTAYFEKAAALSGELEMGHAVTLAGGE
jgi:murein DD-endopeptidase MepM/ murein hydrolase activator NlpD